MDHDQQDSITTTTTNLPRRAWRPERQAQRQVQEQQLDLPADAHSLQDGAPDVHGHGWSAERRKKETSRDLAWNCVMAVMEASLTVWDEEPEPSVMLTGLYVAPPVP
jgi:hypothetical protein